MDIFEILSNGDRVIVASDESKKIIITWNKSHTFQAFRRCPDLIINGVLSHTSGEWDEIAIRTVPKEPFAFIRAQACGEQWLSEGIGDDR